MNEVFVTFLVADERPDKTMNYPMLHGFMFAIACSPELLPPSAWLPYVFNHSNPKYKNEEEQQSIEANIQVVLETIREQLSMNMVTLPPVFHPAEEMMDNFDEESFYAHWGRGLLMGHNVLSDIWDTYLPEEGKSQQKVCFNALTFFSSKAHAKKLCQAAKIDDLTIETMAETVVENFQLAMRNYANIAISVQKAIDDYGAKHPDS